MLVLGSPFQDTDKLEGIHCEGPLGWSGGWSKQLGESCERLMGILIASNYQAVHKDCNG